MKTSFLDLWKSSAVIQGSLALMFGGSIVYLAVTAQPIPDILVGLVGTIIGFYFGTKSSQTTP